MPSPFPGMDPYLEDPAIFPDLHNRFLGGLSQALNAQLPPSYYSGIASRVWIVASHRRVGPDVDVLRPILPTNGGPATSPLGGVAVADLVVSQPVLVRVVHDDEVREWFLELFAQPGERLVATIELLSRANKTPGAQGRDQYLQKQNEILESQVHLIEIDLLRAGRHATAVPLDAALERTGGFDYHVCVRRFERPDNYFVYPIALQRRLPIISVPLLPGDSPVPIDLQAVLDSTYDAAHYDRRVRYREWTLSPPLSPEHQKWTEQVLRERGIIGTTPSQSAP